MIVRIWGARGSLSAPGPATVGYGGNTSCVEVELADGTTLILDAGSGIRELGQRLAERDPGLLHVCLTHLHLDHVEGLGFFGPLWMSGWKLQFWGPPSATTTLRNRISRYLSPPLFPVGLSEAPSEAIFEDVPREPWRVGSALIEAETVEHRGPTVGYRMEDEGQVLVYLPDHEPYLTAALDDEPEWISGWALAARADLLLHEGRYDQTQFDHSLFYQDPAVIMRVSWVETEPASFEIQLPGSALRYPKGKADKALSDRDRLGSALTQAVQRLKAAGVPNGGRRNLPAAKDRGLRI